MSEVAYLGIPGSFSHTAANAVFGEDANYVGAPSFREIFEEVVDGEAQYGVFPIENSLAGSIYENYDLLNKSGLVIVGEHYLRVEHALLVHPATPDSGVAGPLDVIDRIRKVYSHPKALEQCLRFFVDHPEVEKIPFADTATAARYVSEQADPTIAAIAGLPNADLYGLTVVQDHLEDLPNNYTRFLIAAPEQNATNDGDKCSVVVHLPHVPGSLHEFMQALYNNGCDLTKIESRPMPDKPFEYIFYIDFCFDQKNAKIGNIVEELRVNTDRLAVVGVYKNMAGVARKATS